ncbi:MAG: 2-phosphosulfolactate phosphatase [Rubripirellula sp.]|nr:2-phosphosulfolactate phosphatase [Rubripirellula sp.]
MLSIKTLLLPAFTEASPVDNVLSVQRVQCDLAVVIDVLRATSVIVTALNSGAKQVTTCGTVDEARHFASKSPGRSLLCGERNCKKIDGFDLGNSPLEYVPEIISGAEIFLTTTNGTRAIESMSEVPSVAIASFLNLSSVVEKVLAYKTVCIVCAGTNDQVTLEDVLLAGALVSRVRLSTDLIQVDDASELAATLWQSRVESGLAEKKVSESSLLVECLRDTYGGRNLSRLGFFEDLSVCGQIDSLSGVPMRFSKDPTRFA